MILAVVLQAEVAGDVAATFGLVRQDDLAVRRLVRAWAASMEVAVVDLRVDEPPHLAGRLLPPLRGEQNVGLRLAAHGAALGFGSRGRHSDVPAQRGDVERPLGNVWRAGAIVPQLRVPDGGFAAAERLRLVPGGEVGEDRRIVRIVGAVAVGVAEGRDLRHRVLDAGLGQVVRAHVRAGAGSVVLVRDAVEHERAARDPLGNARHDNGQDECAVRSSWRRAASLRQVRISSPPCVPKRDGVVEPVVRTRRCRHTIDK